MSSFGYVFPMVTVFPIDIRRIAVFMISDMFYPPALDSRTIAAYKNASEAKDPSPRRFQTPQ